MNGLNNPNNISMLLKIALIPLLVLNCAPKVDQEAAHRAAWEQAAENRDTKAFKQLIQSGADINHRGSFSPFGLAVEAGMEDAARALIAAGLDLNQAVPPFDEPPLNVALHQGMEDLFNDLMASGADPDPGDVAKSPLHHAVLADNPRAVARLTGAGADPLVHTWHWSPLELAVIIGNHHMVSTMISSQSCNLRTDPAFMRALETGRWDLLAMFFEHGLLPQSDVDSNDPSRWLPRNHQLWTAILKGNLRDVQTALAKGAEVDAPGFGDGTPLHAAAGMGRASIVSHLLKRGANPAAVDSRGRTALYFAALNGNNRVIDILLEHGLTTTTGVSENPIPIFMQGEGRGLVLIQAAADEHPQTVRRLLFQGIPLDVKGRNGMTPLMGACQTGRLSMVKHLIHLGADVNAGPTIGNKTPLERAAMGNHYGVVEYLVQSGANPNARLRNGKPLITHLALKNRISMVSHLVCLGANVNLRAEETQKTPLIEVASEGSVAMLATLIGLGAGVDRLDFKGNALLNAVAFCAVDNAQTLLTQGKANPNVLTQAGNSPLHLAVDQGDMELVKLLVKHGADVNQADQDGSTPLHIASEQGNEALGRFLISQGADVNRQTNMGYSVLETNMGESSAPYFRYLAKRASSDTLNDALVFYSGSQSGEDNHTNLTCVQTLISEGADVNAVSSTGFFPLVLALLSGNYHVFEFLMKEGADLSLLDDQAESLLRYAVRDQIVWAVLLLLERGVLEHRVDDILVLAAGSGSMAMLELLVEHGASLNGVAGDGSTALIRAAQQGDAVMVSYLLNNGFTNFKARDERGRTASWHAVKAGSLDVLELLIDAEAVQLLVDEKRRAILSLAYESKQHHMVDLILSGGFKKYYYGYFLYDACKRGIKPLVEGLIAKGVDVDIHTRSGTPLEAAAENGHKELVELLIKNGADKNGVIKNGGAAQGGDRLRRRGRKFTPLIAAIRKGHTHIVKTLLQAGADPDIVSTSPTTALIEAAKGGHQEILSLLLAAKPKLINRSFIGYGTALSQAVRAGQKGCVETLLNAGADVNAAGRRHPTPLYLACREGRLDMVKLLLKHNAKSNVAEGRYLPLLGAFHADNPEIVDLILAQGLDPAVLTQKEMLKYALLIRDDRDHYAELLLDHGMAVDAMTPYGHTALMFAAEKANRDLVKKLLRLGANANIRDPSGETALFYGVRSDDPEIIDILINPFIARVPLKKESVVNGDGRNVLHIALAGSKLRAARRLLLHLPKFKDDINDPSRDDHFGNTYLHSAVESGNAAMAALLFENGFKQDRPDLRGETALIKAVQTENEDMTALLLEKNNTLEHKDSRNQTALHHAVMAGSVSMLNLLLEKGADSRAQGYLGRTPLHLAVLQDRVDLAEILLRHKADVDARSDGKKTPLMQAAQQGSVPMVKLLLAHGADKSLAHPSLGKAKFIAKKRNHIPVVELLKFQWTQEFMLKVLLALNTILGALAALLGISGRNLSDLQIERAIRKLGDNQKNKRQQAAAFLHRIGRAVEPLTDILSDYPPTSLVRKDAEAQLIEIGQEQVVLARRKIEAEVLKDIQTALPHNVEVDYQTLKRGITLKAKGFEFKVEYQPNHVGHGDGIGLIAFTPPTSKPANQDEWLSKAEQPEKSSRNQQTKPEEVTQPTPNPPAQKTAAQASTPMESAREPEKKDPMEHSEALKKPPSKISITELGLVNVVVKILNENGIYTVEHLLKKSPRELEYTKFLGTKRVRQILAAVAPYRTTETPLEKAGLKGFLLDELAKLDIHTVEALSRTDDRTLLAINGVGHVRLGQLRSIAPYLNDW